MPGMPSSVFFFCGKTKNGLEHVASHAVPEESATYQAASQVAAALDGRDPFSRRQNEDQTPKQKRDEG